MTAPLPPGHTRRIAPAQSGDVLDDLWWKAEPTPSAGQDTERLRDEIAASLVGRWLSYGEEKGVDDLLEHPDRDGARIMAGHAHLLADSLLDGPLRQLIAERDEARATGQRVRDIHVSDGAETPFCGECGHTYPCLTIRALGGA